MTTATSKSKTMTVKKTATGTTRRPRKKTGASAAREVVVVAGIRTPLGKAGGYAVQGLAAAWIRELHGSFSGVMGLPLFETFSLLSRFYKT